MAESLTFSKKMSSLEYWTYIILFVTNITSWVCFLNWSSITLLTNPQFPFTMSVAIWDYLINVLIFVSISMIAALISGIIADKTFNRMGLITTGFSLISVGMILLAFGLWNGYSYMLYANICVGCGFGINISSIGAYFGD